MTSTSRGPGLALVKHYTGYGFPAAVEETSGREVRDTLHDNVEATALTAPGTD